MRKLLLVIFAGSLLVSGILTSGCGDRITGTVHVNSPPTTRVWVDTLGVTVTSRVKLFWSGDDPDGFVKGFFVTVDTVWTYTTAQESTFTIPLRELDTLIARFRVAAVDDEGNGLWDETVIGGSIMYGPEPFEDLDGNGTYTQGEPFVDLGLVDPSPPHLLVTIKNTPPVVRFAAQTNIPLSTLPAASFLLQGEDLDGHETIVRYRIALNQPDTGAVGWVEIPSSVSLLTLRGNVDSTGDTVSARVLYGSDLMDSGIDVPGMRLDQQNALYVYCEDLSGATSSTARMPDTSGTWLVRRPAGSRRILLVNDFGSANPDPQAVYQNALAQTADGGGGTYDDADVLNLIGNTIPAPLHKPMLIATFKLYQSVFWFGRIANLNYAQNSLPEYMASGGKVFFTTGFQNFIDPQGLPIDFMPIDSLVTSYTDTGSGAVRSGFISRVYLNSVVPSADTTRFPTMVFDRTAIFGSYAVVEAPGHEVIYALDYPNNPPNTQELWVGTPTVGVRSSQGNIIVMTVPVHLMNTSDGGTNRLVTLFERIFRDDFGL